MTATALHDPRLTEPSARVPDTEIRTSWVEVTPEQARIWLQSNLNNRRIRENHLNRLIHDMNSDRYLITHQGVAFDTDGRLLDGQHRLLAIARSGKAQMLLVTTGLPAHAQTQVDGGAKRAASDFLGSYGRIKAGAVRILLATESLAGKISVSTLKETFNEITTADVVAAHPRFDDAMERHLSDVVAGSKNLTRRAGPAAMMAAAVRFPTGGVAALRVYRENGVGYSHGNPALALMRWNSGGGHVPNSVSSFLALKVAHAAEYDYEIATLRAFNRQVIDLNKPPHVSYRATAKMTDRKRKDES